METTIHTMGAASGIRKQFSFALFIFFLKSDAIEDGTHQVPDLFVTLANLP
jgi:hypothetical protein